METAFCQQWGLKKPYPYTEIIPLFEVLQLPNLAQAEALLARGADINTYSFRGEHALHCCAHHEAAVEWLLDHGVDPNVPIQEAREDPHGWRSQAHSVGWTALHIAAERNDLSIVELLLKRGANPNCVDQFGRTPLFAACRNYRSFKRLIRSLIDAGADVNAADKHGYTPLHIVVSSARNHAKAITRLLLYRGANPMMIDAAGRLPIDLIPDSVHSESLRAILRNNMTHRIRLWCVRVQKI